MPTDREIHPRLLPPEEWYPASVAGVRARYVTLRGGERVRVLESEPSGGSPVVLLHGWGGSAYNFRRAFPLLAEAGLTAIAPDLRGHGLSDKPTFLDAYTSAAMVDHVLAVLDAMGVGNAVFVGQSMAGAIVMDLVRTAPNRVRAAVLLASIGFTRIQRVAVARALRSRQWPLEHVPRWAIELLLRRVYGTRATWEPRDVDEYWAPTQFAENLQALLALVDSFDWSPRVQAVTSVPEGTLRILFGQRDRLIPAYRAIMAARQITGARARIVVGAGHLLAEEAPDETVREILEVAGTR